MLNRRSIRIGESLSADIKLVISTTTFTNVVREAKETKGCSATYHFSFPCLSLQWHARTLTISSVTSGGGGGSDPFANRQPAALHPAPMTSFTRFVEFLGASLVNRAPIMLHPEAGRWTGGEKVTLEYLATKEDLAIVGGLRLLLLVDTGEVDKLPMSTSVEDGEKARGAGGEARNFNEWRAIGEAWVTSSLQVSPFVYEKFIIQ